MAELDCSDSHPTQMPVCSRAVPCVQMSQPGIEGSWVLHAWPSCQISSRLSWHQPHTHVTVTLHHAHLADLARIVSTSVHATWLSATTASPPRSSVWVGTWGGGTRRAAWRRGQGIQKHTTCDMQACAVNTVHVGPDLKLPASHAATSADCMPLCMICGARLDTVSTSPHSLITAERHVHTPHPISGPQVRHPRHCLRTPGGRPS